MNVHGIDFILQMLQTSPSIEASHRTLPRRHASQALDDRLFRLRYGTREASLVTVWLPCAAAQSGCAAECTAPHGKQAHDPEARYCCSRSLGHGFNAC